MIIDIILAMLVVGAIGLLAGLFLGIASEKFKIETNEKIEKILQVLPGNNCGGCGYAGCAAVAEAIYNGVAKIDACPVGGEEVAKKIANIMGIENTTTIEKKVAFVKCNGKCDSVKKAYNYKGVSDCNAISVLPNKGEKRCIYACMGYGSCVKVCKFDAIHIINGVACVDKEKCVACKACINICPMNIIELVPYSKKHLVTCSSLDKGIIAKEVCNNSCIACKICEKNCPNGSIKVENNLAKMNFETCTDCGVCQEKCPRKVIK